ncbi:MAG TPA: bile acid:sodium symporter [Kofleriaceae bacterium]|nr:bile acid:sodium symporter [Kofleriaceae bacterium]
MIDLLRSASSLSILVFAISSMFAAGLSFTLREIVAPLREPDRVLRAILANFVLVPLLAAAIARVMGLDAAQSIGLILIGSAAGAPFLLKLTAAAAGDVALSTSLLVLLVPLTVVLMPIVVPLLAPEAAVNAAAIAVPLVATLLLPLAIGLVISGWAPRWTTALQPIARTVSTIALVALLVFTIAVNAHHVAAVVASRALLAVLALLAGAFAIGYAVARPQRETRIVLGLGTAQRNIAAATVVAAEDIKDADTLVLVVVASILDLAVLIPFARWLRGRRAAPPGPEAGEGAAEHGPPWLGAPQQPSAGGST